MVFNFTEGEPMSNSRNPDLRAMFSAVAIHCLLFIVFVQFTTVFTGDFRERYIGCYTDAADHAMDSDYTTTLNAMSHDMCYRTCYDKSTTFFGLEASDWCACGDSYTKHGASSNCVSKCPGNNSQICGGEWALSVFSVCAKGYYGQQCNKTCGHCQNSTEYTQQCLRNGTCPAGCTPGWTRIGCNTDIDECSANKGNCSHNCSNTPGSYRCSCWIGYTLDDDDHTCNDIDECLLSNGNCSQNCTNTPGSYMCYCTNGYTLDEDGHACNDINECLIKNGNCSQICNNTIGSFYCSCFKGYESKEDKRTCDDIDECLSNNGNCSHNCTNTPGSYRCSCRSGYELKGDWRICDDIDECLVNNGSCEHSCTNILGSYMCSCRSGYTLAADSHSCQAVVTKTDHGNSLVALVVLILIIPIVIVLVLVVRRHCKKSKISEDEKPDLKNENPGQFRIKSSVRHTIYPDSLDDEDENETNDVNESQEMPETNTTISPIYEDFNSDDPETSKTRIKVTDLPELVARITRMPDLLHAEFKKIPMSTDASCGFAAKPEVKSKNRFKNILPYDRNRTRLSDVGGDPLTTYINASFIRGYNHEDKLIATQGPTVATLNDFWRMIWEYNVGVIVMLTKCFEDGKKKCEQYWPETHEIDFGSVTVTTTLFKETPGCTTRKLQVSNNGASRMVTQLQMMDWPDNGVPEHAISLLALRHLVRRLSKPDQYTLVHCSAGVGRTGTYLAVDYLLAQATDEQAVDIFECVKGLREQRMHSVQTKDQYSFIFKAVLEGLILGETTQSLTHLKDHISKFRDVNPLTKKSILVTEFQMLQEMAPLPQHTDCSDALSAANKSKNRQQDLVPMNSKRVSIQQRTKGRTDYINAVYVPSFHSKSGYISTQLPLPETVGDFWNMCVDYQCKVIVFLCTTEHSEELFSFLPTSDNSLQFASTSVRLLPPVATKENENIEMIKVVATRSDRQQSENVYENTRAVQSGDAGDHVMIAQVVLSENMGSVHNALSKAHSVVDDRRTRMSSAVSTPVVVMSRDGVKFCGQFIAVSNLLDMIKSQQEVDVYQMVYHVKKAQPHFFAEMTEYEEMYKFAEAYAEQTSIYYNT